MSVSFRAATRPLFRLTNVALRNDNECYGFTSEEVLGPGTRPLSPFDTDRRRERKRTAFIITRGIKLSGRFTNVATAAL